ncbi:MAG: NVEALA domain-containing protein [Tannerellaceae bacterium]|jgi:hypothetical protein|nr:NVEALA domain-containing protein [Tannerellaceae bacterium]
MKTKLFCIVFVAVVAVAAAWNFNQNQDEATLSDLALENVEALANGKGGGGGMCSKPGSGCIIRYSDGNSTYVSGRWN